MLSVPTELYDKTEGELREQCKPTGTDYALRVSFWREFDKVITMGKKRIVTAEVFGGICTEAYFYNRILRNPLKTAWLCRPVQAYAKELEAILHRGTERLWQLIEMDIEDPKTKKISSKKAALFLKVFSEVSNRAKGMAVKRITQDRRTVSVKVDANKAVIPQDLDSIRKRIAQIEGTNGTPRVEVLEGSVIDEPGVSPIQVTHQDGEREITVVGVP
jgi:hypothetical protein